MESLGPIKLEEYAGHKFFIEYVSTVPSGNWLRVYTTNGQVYNLTIGYAESIDRAREEVIEAFKKHLDGGGFQ